MICTMLVYNFYTSSVVGDILSNPIKGPETLEDLISSPLILSFQDIGYHKVLFHVIIKINDIDFIAILWLLS